MNSRELGLAIGMLGAKYLLGTSDLHYGYWPENLPVKLLNLGRAQECFSDFLVSHIPPGVQSILDVGCGTGALAERLLGMGHAVDCVCPNAALVRQARRRLKDRAEIFECKFESLETDRRYDLFVFSESFQYIKTYKGLEKAIRLRKKGAYLLICDFFKTDAPGECAMGGGANLKGFYELMEHYRCFERIKDIDITARTAPTMELVNSALKPMTPVWAVVRTLMGGRNSPLYGAKLKRIERKYFSGLRTAEHFATYKSYRLLLYRVRRAKAQAGADGAAPPLPFPPGASNSP